MKQHSTKLLAGVLFLLVTAFVLTKLFRSPARESNLDSDFLKVDTAQVSEIRLGSDTDSSDQIRLQRVQGRWKVAQGNVAADADAYAIDAVLRTLAGLSFERMVTRNEEKWNAYGVADTTSVKVEVYGGGNEMVSLLIGEERSGSTYVRPAGGVEVFAVNGMLRSTFGKEFNDFRNRAFTRLDDEAVNRLTFIYPADSGFVIAREGSRWMLQGAPADSASVEKYLNSLRVKNLSAFADDFVPPGDPDMRITIQGDSSSLEDIRGWLQPDSTWRLTSSLRDGVYFSNKGSTIVSDVFKGKEEFDE